MHYCCIGFRKQELFMNKFYDKRSLFGTFLNNGQKYYSYIMLHIPTIGDIFDYHCSLFHNFYDFD